MTVKDFILKIATLYVVAFLSVLILYLIRPYIDVSDKFYYYFCGAFTMYVLETFNEKLNN